MSQIQVAAQDLVLVSGLEIQGLQLNGVPFGLETEDVEGRKELFLYIEDRETYLEVPELFFLDISMLLLSSFKSFY